MKTITKFESFDGKVFDDEATCKRHERENAGAQLVGLTIEQVQKAITREDAALGDAIEALASKIRQARLDAGDRKRAPRQAKGEPSPP